MTQCVDCPFVVVVDSREQLPFQFSELNGEGRHRDKPLNVETVTAALWCGDYSVFGLESVMSVERKSVSDLRACAFRDRERFEKQLARLNTLPHPSLVVEGDWSQLKAEVPQIKALHHSVVSWQYRFNRIRWWFCPTRRFAEYTTFRLMAHAFKTISRNGMEKLS